MDIKITVDAPGLVQALENLAAALANQPINPLPTSAPVKEAKKETVKKEAPKKEEPIEEVVEDQVEETKEDGTPEITLVTVRSHLQKLQDAGRQKDAKAILVDLGHKKLSDVPEDEYSVIIAKVEELLA